MDNANLGTYIYEGYKYFQPKIDDLITDMSTYKKTFSANLSVRRSQSYRLARLERSAENVFDRIIEIYDEPSAKKLATEIIDAASVITIKDGEENLAFAKKVLSTEQIGADTAALLIKEAPEKLEKSNLIETLKYRKKSESELLPPSFHQASEEISHQLKLLFTALETAKEGSFESRYLIAIRSHLEATETAIEEMSEMITNIKAQRALRRMAQIISSIKDRLTEIKILDTSEIETSRQRLLSKLEEWRSTITSAHPRGFSDFPHAVAALGEPAQVLVNAVRYGKNQRISNAFEGVSTVINDGIKQYYGHLWQLGTPSDSDPKHHSQGSNNIVHYWN